MVKPLSVNEQIYQTPFVQNRTLAVYFGMSHFDNVVKKNEEGLYKPALGDLLSAKQDCLDLQRCLE